MHFSPAKSKIPSLLPTFLFTEAAEVYELEDGVRRKPLDFGVVSRGFANMPRGVAELLTVITDAYCVPCYRMDPRGCICQDFRFAPVTRH